MSLHPDPFILQPLLVFFPCSRPLGLTRNNVREPRRGASLQSARCIHCRSDISVPDSYAHGDHIKCGACGTRHKVQRGDVLRLVLADIGPLKDALEANMQLISRLEDELRGARASFGIGANGFGLGVVYAIWQVGFQNQMIDLDLLLKALSVAIASGIALEAANYLFLAKRQRMMRLSEEIQEAREEGRHLQQKIRDASRV